MPCLTLITDTNLIKAVLVNKHSFYMSNLTSSIPDPTCPSMQHADLLFDVQCLVTSWYHKSQLASLPPISIVCVV
jgi:hypothetical protein